MLAVAAARYRLRPEDDALARALLDTAVSQTSQEPLGRARTALELLSQAERERRSKFPQAADALSRAV